MVLPDEIADAAYDGDVDAVRAFLEQHPTRLTPWQKYCLLPPKELLRLRSLVARGRARERRRLRSKTPREIVNKLYDVSTKLLAKPEMQTALKKMGVVPMPMEPKAIDDLVVKEVAANMALLKTEE